MATGEASGRAPYAADPAASRGRLYEEPASPTRTVFQRDCDRIVHSTAFRRLKDKTQVFPTEGGDHYRTRLTHTLEVSRIARSLARALGLDEDLTEAVALAHDLGHPPFGHAGERALASVLAGEGGFDHNAQALRIATRLERRYPAFDGLNLTFEVLEGIAKHNGPVTDPAKAAELSAIAGRDLLLTEFPTAEAEVAALADDIAYDAHDLDDGLRAGLIDLDLLRELAGVGPIVAAIRDEHPGLERPRLIHELTRRLIALMVDDALAETRRRAGSRQLASADDVRRAGVAIVAFSVEGAALDKSLKAFLTLHVYRHPRVTKVTSEAEALVRRLFLRYRDDASALPPEWRAVPAAPAERARDFIAGMTDRFALAEAARLFDGASV